MRPLLISRLHVAVKVRILKVQSYFELVATALWNLFRRPFYLDDMWQQADIIGVASTPIVLSACFFTGASLALNSQSTLSRFGASSVIGQLVAIGIIRELGPVLAGLVVAGRNASGIASELGSMVVTEQIDAMRALGVDPMKKLVTPRVMATIIMMFFLTILSDFLGLLGGNCVASGLYRSSAHQFWSNAINGLVASDIVIGLSKPFLFGMVVATIGSYFGLSTKGGTQGVGRSTTQAVVVSMVLIIALDVFATQLVMEILGV